MTYSSNALEGNSLTETETKIPIRDYYEAIGHSAAYDYLYTLLKQNVVTEAQIKKLHKLFYRLIDEKNAGRYRKQKVFISGSRYRVPDPEQISALMSEYINQLVELRKSRHPVEFAALAHKGFVFIHPFVDGNGRVARLLRG